MFNIFGKNKTESFLGIDIGGSSVKLIEISNAKGHPKLETYGYLERSLVSKTESLLDEPQRAAEILKQVMKKAGTKTINAIAALPAHSVFSAVVNLPVVSKKELSAPKKLAAAVEWEAKKVVPVPLEEMVLDWKVLENVNLRKGVETPPSASQKEDQVKNLQVLLTGASKQVVKKYLDVFQRAAINLVSLETESFALSRALLGKDKSVVMIVDLGANDTNVIVVENGIPYIERAVKQGGKQLTEAMSKVLDLSVENAEQYKKDFGRYLLAGRHCDLNMPDVIKDFLNPIVNEMRYVINFFLEQPGNKNKRIERIILSGGSAVLLNLGNHLSDKFNIRSFVGSPWARIIYPENLQPVLDEIGPRFAPAIGLAMRNF